MSLITIKPQTWLGAKNCMVKLPVGQWTFVLVSRKKVKVVNFVFFPCDTEQIGFCLLYPDKAVLLGR